MPIPAWWLASPRRRIFRMAPSRGWSYRSASSRAPTKWAAAITAHQVNWSGTSFGQASSEFGDVEPSYKPGVRLGDLRPSLPAYAIEAIREALPAFGRQIHGFDRDDAVLPGIETRTSSPVRITRNHETLESLNVAGLYPAGEGAGYAGGILSAGVDGIRVAEAVAKSLLSRATHSSAVRP